MMNCRKKTPKEIRITPSYNGLLQLRKTAWVISIITRNVEMDLRAPKLFRFIPIVIVEKNVLNDRSNAFVILTININIRWLKNASALTVFKDTRYDTFWYEVNKDFISFCFLPYFLTSDQWSAHTDENSVIGQLVIIS